MLNLLYDAFELQKMGEYSDNHGGTFCEPALDDEDGTDEECLRMFWAVQGHLPGGGVDTFIENDDEILARCQFDFLWMLLESHTKLQSIKKELEI